MSSRGLKFEEEFREFLKDLDFQDVDGGRNFRINGRQVDAVAGHESTLLVIECKTKRKLMGEIDNFRGKMKTLKKGFKKHATYKKYKKFRFIMAVNMRKIREEDLDHAQKTPQVYIWDGRFKRYYEKLLSLIGKYAKYNILAEIAIKPAKKSVFSAAALKTEIRGFVTYLFFIDPRKLLEFSYVARRERGEEQYYQRFIKENRLKSIVRFLDEKRGIFPTNVVISIEKPDFNSKITEKGFEIGVLKFPKNYRSCWVIDGQHRLYGFCHSSSTIKVPVLAFEKLKLKQHATFFLQINKEQQKVPPDLLWDLEGLLRRDELEGIISRIVKRLNRKRGPLQGKIYIPVEGFRKKKRGKLRLSGFCKSLEKAKLSEKYSSHLTPAKGINPLCDEEPDETVRKVANALNRYFGSIDEHFDEEKRDKFVYTNGGISVMIYLFERILAGLGKNPSKKDLKTYLLPVSNYLGEISDLRSIRDRCNSEGGRDSVVQDFLKVILKETGDKEVCVGIETLDLTKILIEEFEPAVRDFIGHVLVTKFPTKWNERIPSDITTKISDRHGISPPDNEFFQYLDLGDCEKIIRTSKNAKTFSKILLDPKFGFGSESELWALYHMLRRVRNPKGHGREIVLKYRDEDLIFLIVDKFRRIFREHS